MLDMQIPEEVETGSAERFEYELAGAIEVSWQERATIKMTHILLSILEEQDYINDILLVVEFEPFSAMQLSKDIPLMKAVADGVYTYSFTMKPEVRQKYQADFAQAAFLDDWLAIGEGACLHLENYDCQGRGEFPES